ncbi:hypothetical protein C8A03DRAFT_42835 [Achaetomium macrosporum]|uniref:Uncharacterized protein n=1 Tax=Achaetomium macrosporum TaxID=79813 RepID=A0AAN7CE07_9PEZI|nr:hypothetical protein C8A03DRAFT_42835 [Achaetomium macrosporum]
MFSSAAAHAKGHKHGSGHGKRQNTSKHSKPTKTKESARPVNQGTNPYSFLFVVNEFQVDYEPIHPRDRPLTDSWLNIMPPEEAAAYRSEVIGTVFRYQNGIISPAHGYVWYRPQMGAKGCIVRINQASVIDGYPIVYSETTVFSCSPLLPMIVTRDDASLGGTFMRRVCECDRRFDGYSAWSLLHFTGGDSQEGISSINSYASGAPCVVGKDPSWIPSLVPSVYRNTKPSAPPSQGLAGELGIILALMGFHGKKHQASDVFLNRTWHLNRWNGPGRASNYLPKEGDSPRGLFVQVCLDNLVDDQPDDEEHNIPQELCEQVLSYLEYGYGSILVQG